MVCIIEIMKMMNSVPAGVSGTIVEICADDAQLVGDGEPLFRVETAVSERVEIVDTTTRDGNQSLWGATGLTTPDVTAIAPAMDRVGFRALDFTSSTHMAVSVRFHREDPWERIRLVSAAMPNTPLNFITTGMRFISWVPAGEDVIRLSFRLVARNGIRRVQIADPSNDPDSLIRLARMAREEGIEEVVVGLTYSISPAHTHDYYAERAAAVAASPDIDRLYLKDPGGLLTVDAVRELVPKFIAAFAPRPVELHSHCTIGLGPMAYVEGLRAGHPHAAHRGRAGGQRHLEPARPRRRCATSRRRASRTASTWRRSRSCPSTSARSRSTAGCRSARPPSTTPPTTATRCRAAWSPPRAGSWRRWAAPSCSTPRVEEVTRVRAEMGYPIMVTPVSQFVVTQAVANVLSRRALVERVGRDGALLPRPLLRAGRAGGPGGGRPRALAAARRRAARSGADQPGGRALALRRADLRGGAAAAADDAGGAGGRDGGRRASRRRRRWRGPAAIRSCGCWPSWPSATSATSGSRRATTWWCGAVRLDDVRGFVFDVDGSLVHRGPDFRAEPLPGAVEVLEAIRASGPAAGAVHERQPHGPGGVRRGADATTACR